MSRYFKVMFLALLVAQSMYSYADEYKSNRIAIGDGQFSTTRGKLGLPAFIDRFKEITWLQESESDPITELPLLDQKTFELTYDYQSQFTDSYTTYYVENDKWIFEKPSINSNWPDRAIQISDTSDAEKYHIEVIVHCYASDSECSEYISTNIMMKSLPPSNSGDVNSYKKWRSSVLREKCTSTPIFKPQPAYPLAALKGGYSGIVEVQVLLNSCGNVRDAWIYKSSRNRDLDRAAIKQVRKWEMGSDFKHDDSDEYNALVSVDFKL